MPKIRLVSYAQISLRKTYGQNFFQRIMLKIRSEIRVEKIRCYAQVSFRELCPKFVYKIRL